jgi:hypothetical protein
MCRYIVNKPARSMFHDHQHVKQSERRARDDAEVAGNDRLGVVLEKKLTSADRREVYEPVRPATLADTSGPWRRHAPAEFQQQLVCNALLTPRGILARHSAD